MKKLKSARRVAIELGLSHRTLHVWLVRGLIKPTEIKHDMRGNLYYFSEEDVKKVSEFWEKRKKIAEDRRL